jgi:thioredoxin reductase
MAVDTPAKIAILGAGPIGLEAALYARFLGYDVDIYEGGQVAENVLRWGHVRMFSPFGMNRSTLGLAALKAQDAAFVPPDDHEVLTGREFADGYLQPLSRTDLLADHLKLNTAVVSIGREDFLKGELIGNAERADFDFRILSLDADGNEMVTSADVVVDTTGVYGNPNWAGQGGAPAVGERGLRDQIEYGVPDVAGKDRERYANRNTLLIGCGYSAATTVVALAKLAEEEPGTKVTWIVRRERPAGPVSTIEADRLAERAGLTKAANQLATETSDYVSFRPATSLWRIERDPERNCFRVVLAGEAQEEFEFDNIVANVGYRPDNRIYEELQVHECYASQGPMKLAAALLGAASADCLDQTSHGAATLMIPEPNFYILGAKSYGRNSNFLLSIGLDQIRELFTTIGDREDLDLYTNAQTLLR